MKNKKWWIKFKNGNARLVILILVSFTTGLHLLISPETVNHLIIRGAGLVWTMEAISYCLELRLNYLKKQKQALTIHSVIKSFCDCGGYGSLEKENNIRVCDNCSKEKYKD